jgi:carbon storage regulator
MLITRRRVGESLIIADHIEIDVIEIGPTRVKLGIKAPQHVKVVRGEVWLTAAQNIAAGESMTKEHVDGMLMEIEKTDPYVRPAVTDIESEAILSSIKELGEPGVRHDAGLNIPE